jgi:hypothetical protein
MNRDALPALKTSALAFVAAALTLALLMIIDSRTLPASGNSIWVKPIRFFLSFAIHAASMILFVRLLARVAPSGPILRLALWLQVGVMWVELFCITLQAARGVESHFNYATSFDTWIFRVMGWGIGVLLISQFLLLAELFRKAYADSGLKFILVAGVLLSLFGSAVGFWMVMPTTEQKLMLAQDLKPSTIGAHLVDAPTTIRLPFMGWDLGAGDWRLAHFVGLHGLQFALLLGWLHSRAGKPGLKLSLALLSVYAALFLTTIAITYRPSLISALWRNI